MGRETTAMLTAVNYFDSDSVKDTLPPNNMMNTSEIVTHPWTLVLMKQSTSTVRPLWVKETTVNYYA